MHIELRIILVIMIFPKKRNYTKALSDIKLYKTSIRNVFISNAFHVNY